MSHRNVEQFLQGAEALNRGAMDSALARYAPDVVFEPQAAAMEGTFNGRDGVRQFFSGLAEHYDFFRAQFSEIRDLGDRVLALGTMTTRAKASGIEQEAPLAIVATYRDGLVTHFKDYGDDAEALKAAGLPE
jgi:uncharacterized protein